MILAVGGACLAVPVLAGCGSSGASSVPGGAGSAGGSSSSGGGTIVLGSLYTSATGIDYSSAPPGAEAYVAQVNAAGGVNGHKLQLLTENDGGSPATAAAAARKLVSEGAVAFVGGDSTVDCSVNAPFYQEQGLVSVPALGSNPKCFASPQIIPAQNGAFVAAVQSATLLLAKLHAHRVQYITFDAPSGHDSDPPMQAYLNAHKASAGPTVFVTPGQDPTAAIVRAKHSGADSYLILATPDVSISILKALTAQGVSPQHTPVAGVLTIYDRSVPPALGAAGNGVWATTDWLPFIDSTAPAVTRFTSAMARYESSARVDALAQSAYVAADLLTTALRSIHGSYTASSVSRAVKSVSGFSDGLTGGPLSVGTRSSYIINPYDFIVRIVGGQWRRQAQLGLVSFPPAGFKLPG